MSLLVCGLLLPLVLQLQAAPPASPVPPRETQVELLTLEAAIAEALRHSPALEPARDGVALAEIGHARARSEFGLRLWPSWSTMSDDGLSATQVGVSIERALRMGTSFRLSGDVQRQTGASSVAPNAWSGAYSVAIAQPLLAPFNPATTARLRDAERGVVSHQRALEESRRELVVRVAQVYFAVVRQQRLAEAAQRAVARAEQLREASEARTRVGLATRLDVLRADLLASEARAQLESQIEALAEHVDQLKVMLDRPLEEPLEVDAGSIGAAPEPSPPAGLETLIRSAMSSRLDVTEMRDRVQDARRALSVAKWNLVPDVTVEATYSGRPSAASFQPADVFVRPGWRVRVGAAYAFDYAGAKASVASAEIAARAAARRLDDFAQVVETDVRRAARAVDRAAARIEIQAKAKALAEQQLALAEMRYERGLAGNFDVIDAEANLFQAESALIAAQVDRALAALLLERAAGLLDPERFLR